MQSCKPQLICKSNCRHCERPDSSSGCFPASVFYFNQVRQWYCRCVIGWLMRFFSWWSRLKNNSLQTLNCSFHLMFIYEGCKEVFRKDGKCVYRRVYCWPKCTNGLQEFYDAFASFLIPKRYLSTFCNCMDYKHNSSKYLFSLSHTNAFIINSLAMFIIQSHLEVSF